MAAEREVDPRRIRGVTWVAETTSTNDLARDAFIEDGRLWHVFVAGTQTSGRGRRGRRWVSPPGCGLYLSMALPCPGEHLTWLPLATGVAAAQAIERLLDDPVAGQADDERKGAALPPRPVVRLKWPNDLYIKGRKLGGILCERVQDGPRKACVVGLGINIDRPLKGLSSVPPVEAISLAEATGLGFRRGAVLGALLPSLAHWFDLLCEGEIISIGRAFAARDEFSGSFVRVDEWVPVLGGQSPSGPDGETCRALPPLYGSVLGLNPEGGLRLATFEGHVVDICSGTVRRVENQGWQRGLGG